MFCKRTWRYGGVLALLGVSAALWLRPNLAQNTVPGLCVAGDIRARQMAYVAPGLSQRYLDARTMRYGIGTGAIGTWDSLGDALAVGGRLWLRSTNPQSPRFYDVVANPFFLTNSFTYVAAGAQPRETRALNPTTFAEAWRQLAERYADGVFVAGYVRFTQLQTIALSRPPLRALPVATHSQMYYTRPMETAENVWTYVVGVSGNSRRAEARRMLARVLPTEPNAAPSPVGYGHALVLQHAPRGDAMPVAEDVVNLGRIVGTSTIAEGKLDVYLLDRLRDCTQQ